MLRSRGAACRVVVELVHRSMLIPVGGRTISSASAADSDDAVLRLAERFASHRKRSDVSSILSGGAAGLEASNHSAASADGSVDSHEGSLGIAADPAVLAYIRVPGGDGTQEHYTRHAKRRTSGTSDAGLPLPISSPVSFDEGAATPDGAGAAGAPPKLGLGLQTKNSSRISSSPGAGAGTETSGRAHSRSFVGGGESSISRLLFDKLGAGVGTRTGTGPGG